MFVHFFGELFCENTYKIALVRFVSFTIVFAWRKNTGHQPQVHHLDETQFLYFFIKRTLFLIVFSPFFYTCFYVFFGHFGGPICEVTVPLEGVFFFEFWQLLAFFNIIFVEFSQFCCAISRVLRRFYVFPGLQARLGEAIYLGTVATGGVFFSMPTSN